MAKSKKLDSILVSLDCLLDTRLATVSKINLDIANKLLDGDDYHTRDQDVFVGIDKEYFKEVYKNRDIETLKKSSLTNIVPLLRHLVSKLKEQSIVRPFHDGGNIVVNMYPYKLTIDEQDEICAAIAVWMQGLAPVSLVNLSPTDLNPIYCKNNYALMIMYDYEEWLEVNAKLFLKTQIPEITMFVPAIYFVNKPTKEELDKMLRESMHPMKAIKTLAMGIISLEIIDVVFFSVLNKKYKDIIPNSTII